MKKYIRWFAGLRRFYQILVGGALFMGLAAFATAAATDSPLFLVLSAFWLAVAPAIVYLAADRDEEGTVELTQ